MSTTNALRQLIEAMNVGDLAAIASLLAPEFIDHDVYYGEEEKGCAAFLDFVRETRAAFPDFHFALQEDDVVDNRIWGRFTASATMRGEFAGQSPTGRSAIWNEMHFVRIDPQTGLILEHYGAGADDSMLTQLGLRKPLLPDGSLEVEQNPHL
jgi:predicted ester cyclase